MKITLQQKENEPCVFCAVPEIKAQIIWQNDYVWAFPTNIPITEGHTLIAPKRCVAQLEDLTKEEKIAIIDASELIMKALRISHHADGFNCVWNQGKLAGQSVPHFHLHIIPRKQGDTGLLGYDPRSMLYRTGDRLPTEEKDLLRTRDQIKSCINEIL